MRFGTTFSANQANYLGINPGYVIQQINQLKNLQIVRLPTYWNQIETTPNHYDFYQIESQIQSLSNKDLVLVLGAKSPRWPEFYYPSWHKPLYFGKQLAFLEKTLKKLKKYSNIIAWQLENEPLDPSGPNKETIPLHSLISEFQLIKSLDSRPVIQTFWANHPTAYIPDIADVVGLDLYYQVPYYDKLPFFYRGPIFDNTKISKIFKKANKPLWITELQAESWPPYKIKPSDIQKHFQNILPLKPKVVLFWGVEEWCLEQKNQNPSFITQIKAIINS